MAVDNGVDPGGQLAEQIGAGEPDVLRSMVKTMAEALMSAETDAVCGADHGTRSDERVNHQRRSHAARTPSCSQDGVLTSRTPKLASPHFADRTGALLATTATSKGMFATDPMAVGVSGGFATEAAANLLREADLVVASDASMNSYTTRHGTLYQKAVIVRDVQAPFMAELPHGPRV
jgi:Transposase, Mutator family